MPGAIVATVARRVRLLWAGELGDLYGHRAESVSGGPAEHSGDVLRGGVKVGLQVHPPFFYSSLTSQDLFGGGEWDLENILTLTPCGSRKYPYSQRQPGDAVFFGGACDCTNWDTIYHVGLMIDSGDRLWAAPNYNLNRVMETSISAVGDTPCADVIRFS